MAKRKPPKPNGEKPPPRCKAILLCNDTIIEAGTGNVSLIGTFDGFVQRAFPSHTKPFTVFVQLTDGIGRYEVVIEVQDLRDNIVNARANAGLEFPERLTKVNMMIPVPPLPLQHAGVYDFVVLANGQEIDRQQFRAVSLEDLRNASGNT